MLLFYGDQSCDLHGVLGDLWFKHFSGEWPFAVALWSFDCSVALYISLIIPVPVYLKSLTLHFVIQCQCNLEPLRVNVFKNVSALIVWSHLRWVTNSFLLEISLGFLVNSEITDVCFNVFQNEQRIIFERIVCGGRSGAIWLPSHHPGRCCKLVVVEETPPPPRPSM